MTDALPVVLGLGWGAMVATPLVRRANRITATASFTRRDSRSLRLMGTVPGAWIDAIRRRAWGPAGRVLRAVVERRTHARREAAIQRELPVTVDLLAVAVGAGCTPRLAVDVAAHWAPPVVASCLDAVQRECDLGAGFGDALDGLAESQPVLRPLGDALLVSDRFGAPVADALGRLAVEERAALRRRAEARARTVPVKLLFPLVFLVLPAFALLTVVPALLAGFSDT